MTENALKGIYNGGTIPFGYMIDETRHYQPDPLLAPYVEQTFQKYADGATMTDLRDWLKAHNIKNSMGGEMTCSIRCRKSWRKIKRPLPVIRQRKAICSPLSCTAVSAER